MKIGLFRNIMQNSNKSIFEVIRNQANMVSLSSGFDRVFDKVLENHKSDYTLLVPNDVLLDRGSLAKLFSEYYIHELFDLSNCYLGTYNTRYAYWHVSKKKPEAIRMSYFYNEAHPYRDRDRSIETATVSDKYNDDYCMYINALDRWLDTGEPPESTSTSSEFMRIDYDEFEVLRPYSFYYRQANNDIRSLLRSSNIKMLSELAEIEYVKPEPKSKDAHMGDERMLSGQDLTYPYDPELNSIGGIKTTHALHKSDIIQLRNSFFLIDKESSFDLFAPPGHEVIRAKEICPEYLYIYLNSETARKIRFALSVPAGDSIGIGLPGAALKEFPVVIPEKEDSYYIKRFEAISTPQSRFYEKEEAVSNNALENQLIEEMLQRIKLQNKELVEKLVQEDISELSSCYKSQAYKAGVIMAGSVLEALLIDWLSELKGVNYFENDLMKRRYDKKSKQYKTDENGNYVYTEKTAVLEDYINEIEDINKPNWTEEAKEAHEIRKTRNLVHAKLYLKDQTPIDKNMCSEIINKLLHIIKSRGVIIQSTVADNCDEE